MATTTFGVNDSLSNKLWAKKLSAEALKETYFGKFMGTSSDNMIYMKSEAFTNAGYQVTFGLRMYLQSDGITESQTLMSNEDSLTTYSGKIIDQRTCTRRPRFLKNRQTGQPRCT